MSTQLDSIVPLATSPTRAAELVQVMSRAFLHDPTFLYTLPEETTRLDRLHWFFRFLIRYGSHYGDVYTTSTTDGGAIWISPKNTSFTVGQMLQTGFLAMPLAFGWAGFVRFMSINDLIEKWRKQSGAEEHWYLAGLGVEPSRQGRGIGGALLGPGLARADAEGFPCYLETLTEENLAFYEKHGFHVAASGSVPNGGPMVWSMIRPPHR